MHAFLFSSLLVLLLPFFHCQWLQCFMLITKHIGVQSLSAASYFLAKYWICNPAFQWIEITRSPKTIISIAPALLMQLRTNTKMAVTCWDGDMDVTERKYLSREDIVHGAQKFIPVFNHVAFLRNRQPISPPIKKHPSPKGRTSFSTASS